MKVILIGATGILGKKLFTELQKDKQLNIITVSRTGGTDINADISDPEQIKAMYTQTGKVDAVICAAGECYFGAFDTLTEEQLYVGIRSKMMGQINLVLQGRNYINEGGSFTLTSGFLSDDPVPGGIGYAMANGAIENFVLAAAMEFKGRARINAVSPGWVTDQYDGPGTSHLPGQLPVSPERVTHAYYKSALGFLTGQVFRVWEPSTQYVRK
jgi:NAD(P)-dependent dehydrogenase (short-subunit alcohol dehydrogenase family)